MSIQHAVCFPWQFPAATFYPVPNNHRSAGWENGREMACWLSDGFASGTDSAGPHGSASGGKYQLEIESLAQQNHMLFPLSEQQSFGQIPTKIPGAAWTGDPCVLKAPKVMFPPLARSSAFGFPTSLDHKVRKDTEAGEFVAYQQNKWKLSSFQKNKLSRLFRVGLWASHTRSRVRKHNQKSPGEQDSSLSTWRCCHEGFHE